VDEWTLAVSVPGVGGRGRRKGGRARACVACACAATWLSVGTAGATGGSTGIPLEVVAPVPVDRIRALAADDGGFVAAGDPFTNDPVVIVDLDRGEPTTASLAPLAPFTLWGKAVARSNGRIAIGAPATNVDGELLGQVTILERDAFGVWLEAATLTGDVPGGLFGSAIAFDGDTLLVGAPFAAVDGVPAAGQVAVFARDGSRYTRISTLQPAAPSPLGQFGAVLALGTEWLAVGAPGTPVDGLTSAGAVAAFARSGATFTLDATFTSPDPQPLASFGSALAVDGPRLAIGAPGTSVLAERDGAVYTTESTRRGWSPFIRTDGDVAEDNLGFGAWVLVAEDRLVVSVANGNSYRYVVDFRLEDAGWTRIETGACNGPVVRHQSHVAATWSGVPKGIAITAIDLSCEPPTPENDCDNSYLPDDCQIAVDPGIDLDGDGAPDACPIAKATLTMPSNSLYWLHGYVASSGSRTLVWPMVDVEWKPGYKVGPLQIVDTATPASTATVVADAPTFTYAAGSPVALEDDWLAAAGALVSGTQQVKVGSLAVDGRVTWEATFTSEATDDFLGWSLASTANELLATTPGDPNGVFPIRRFQCEVGAGWREREPLIVPTPGPSTGFTLSVDGDRLAVSDLTPADADWSEGRVRIFDVVNGALAEAASIRVPFLPRGSQRRFGTRLRLSGDRLFVTAGTPGAVSLKQREVFVFRETSDGWREEAVWDLDSFNFSRGFDAHGVRMAIAIQGDGAATFARRANGSWGETRSFPTGVRGYQVASAASLLSPSTIGVLTWTATTTPPSPNFWVYDPVDDCNGNGIDDSDEITADSSLDLDENGLLDACDRAGDMNLDGTVDAVDLGILLGRYGNGPGLGDCNDDGTVDAADVAVLLGQWVGKGEQ
jgi:hypothetical protein